ncbi:MAG: hypothetical protein QOI11_1314 [Candidatus Eremiobacteraeota bacterium]|jgi:hypothetical protein|nr:hypothetical protein [Candidatus Eremiobacteraeota bacterium]
MLSVVLALALAQAAPSGSPLPEASAVPAAPAASSGSAMPASPSGPTAPVGSAAPGVSGRPSSGAALTSANDPSLAVIVNSGSTNTAGYTLRVRDDGWTTLAQAGATQHKRLDKALAARFFADLRAAGPLGALPRAMCMKSTSFGSVTTVSYRGARSPDLSCPGSSSAETALGADVNALRDAAGVSQTPGRQLP